MKIGDYSIVRTPSGISIRADNCEALSEQEVCLSTETGRLTINIYTKYSDTPTPDVSLTVPLTKLCDY
jgi:hypothetical protein